MTLTELAGLVIRWLCNLALPHTAMLAADLNAHDVCVYTVASIFEGQASLEELLLEKVER